MNKRMLSRLSAFLRGNKLLVQFFSWPYAGVDDGNIDFWTKTAHSNHFPNQVVDPNSFAHFEHEDIAPVRKASRLDDQASCLRNVHEVASHIRVCHCDRATKIDLSRECGDDTAAAPEDVSEANDRAASGALV